MTDLGQAALGAWSGGVHMHFGLPVGRERLTELLRPGDDIGTVITADAYGAGEADRDVGRALSGLDRDGYRLVGMIGHDFTTGQRAGAKGYPRFTDPALREPQQYGDYLRAAAEASLERCGTDRFDLLMLHNPDHTGYSSPLVWDAMAGLRDAGLTAAIGVAPGPANGFTLDVISCLERFGDRIDWAMLILNPFEPWPARLALPACERAGVRVLARVVDYGGVFWDDVLDEGQFAEHDHRRYRPAGWVGRARGKLERIRPIGERHGLTAHAACGGLDAGTAGRILRGADADPGGRERRQAGRAEAVGAGRGAGRLAAVRSRAGRDRRRRRQRRQHGAEGRVARPRGRAAGRCVAARRRPAVGGRALGDRAGARPRHARLT